jgi:hypothetical protein
VTQGKEITMTISENASVFFKCKVKDFAGPEDWKGPKLAYRLRSGEDEQDTVPSRLEELAGQDGAEKLQALVLGAWGDGSESSAEVIQALVKNKNNFAALKAMFLGDITYEENEMSWIQQSDAAPLLRAFPGLEVLRVRGGTGLKFSKSRHDALKQLIVETGGLPRAVIREICRCEFSGLEHLELWLGIENYGWDGGVEDLQPLLAAEFFPKLQYLGLRNSEIADDIAAVVVNAPILQQLEVLDLSNGTLSDVGAQALLTLSRDIPLKELNLSHHYMTPAMVKQLKKELRCKVVADNPQDPDEEWRAVMVSE